MFITGHSESAQWYFLTSICILFYFVSISSPIDTRLTGINWHRAAYTVLGSLLFF